MKKFCLTIFILITFSCSSVFADKFTETTRAITDALNSGPEWSNYEKLPPCLSLEYINRHYRPEVVSNYLNDFPAFLASLQPEDVNCAPITKGRYKDNRPFIAFKLIDIETGEVYVETLFIEKKRKWAA